MKEKLKNLMQLLSFRAILEGDEGDGLYLLPEDHPIWTGEAKVSPAYIRPLYGGCILPI